MSDRLTEIEANYAAYCEAVRKNQMGLPFLEAVLAAVGEITNVEAFDALCQDWGYVHAPSDIAWLVAEVRRLQSESNSVNAADHSPKLLPSQPANGEPQQTWEPSGPERSRTRGTSLFPPNDPAHRFTQMCEYEAAMTQMEVEVTRLRPALQNLVTLAEARSVHPAFRTQAIEAAKAALEGKK